MKKLQNCKGFLLGMVFMMVLNTGNLNAMAAMVGKTIEVFTGVNIYIDDVKLNPKDANDNPIEAFVYNGTTYLPVRAIGEAYDKVVQWDGKTSSVYIGKHSSTEPAVLLQNLDYFNSTFRWTGIDTQTSEKDNLGKAYNEAMLLTQSGELTYKTNGQYSRLSGTFFQRYSERNQNADYAVTKIEVYGDNKLLFTATMKAGIVPIPFNIDLTGVLELRVKIDNRETSRYSNAALGDCGLYQ